MPVETLDLEISHYLVQGTKFEVDKRYHIIEPMSQGAYGIVCSAEDTEAEQLVALKKMEGVFEDITNTKRTLRELRILRHLVHENLMQVKSVFMTGRRTEFEEIYVVSALMETDLASTLKSPQILLDDHCQFFLYQILRGMMYVHSARVIHRDLKPRNLLVNSNCDLKICDFGLARVQFADQDWACPMTGYVCTRWYRAPEVLCSWTDYSTAVDIWSIGCILAELFTRTAIFPGHNTQHQLDLIIAHLGSPDLQELAMIPNEKCRKFIKSLPKREGRRLPEVFQAHASPAAQELMGTMLRWDPTMRITASEAVQHEYLQSLHCPEDEPVREPLDTGDFEFERRKITVPALREEIFREALHYHPRLLEAFEREMGECSISDNISKCRLLVPGEAQYSSDEGDDSD
mmetsp:Transcript_8080/g.17577  ORF Transcript_8080/g.17577 Transcript_8080/m.17577 type:complete len:404 (-) Transcript_8080:130-1341(-)|eukprot:CAMPEP_0170619366 /NCGR_PEP_ID=MMETSP0224-20130122/27478_1 /TAXON_ID=285029 /ORGANISM="Togula jolla, Strain CCCM 725" /LENGTH=403 /DNA_ID=CAMNT_0010945451 /DNA_START=82 /DNA_END=1293 /DNA_ORIENTATION=+